MSKLSPDRTVIIDLETTVRWTEISRVGQCPGTCGVCAWCGNFFTNGVEGKPCFCSSKHRSAYEGRASGLDLTAAIIEQQMGPKGDAVAAHTTDPEWVDWLRDNSERR